MIYSLQCAGGRHTVKIKEGKFWKIAALTLLVMLVVAMLSHEPPIKGPGKLLLGLNIQPIQLPGSQRFYLDIFGAGYFAALWIWALAKGDRELWSVSGGALYGIFYLLGGSLVILATFGVLGFLILCHMTWRQGITVQETASRYYEHLYLAALGSGFFCGVEVGMLVGALISILTFSLLVGLRWLLIQREAKRPAEQLL